MKIENFCSEYNTVKEIKRWSPDGEKNICTSFAQQMISI